MNTWKKSAAGLAAVLALGTLAACGDDADDAGAPPSTPSSSDTPMTETDSDLVGAGCAAYAEQVPTGAGSVEGMAQDPVAVAASNNPLLKTLVAAVSGQLNSEVNLVDTLNGDEFTVFAPVDDAFAKLPAETVKTLGTPAGTETLTKVLTYHVVPGQITPDDIAGTQTTVEGADLEVTGSGDSLKVNDANVICGGVKTANATVYLIDAVLMPPA